MGRALFEKKRERRICFIYERKFAQYQCQIKIYASKKKNQEDFAVSKLQISCK